MTQSELSIDTMVEGLSEAELCPPGLLQAQEEAHQRDIETLLWPREAEFVVVPCPACASQDSERVFTKFKLAYRTCRACGTLYMSPRPTEAVLRDFYEKSEAYLIWAEQIFPASEDARARKIHGPWFDRIVEACARYNVTRGRLLEVGPGFGTFAAIAQESGLFVDVSVVEPTPDLARRCRARGLNVIEKPIELLQKMGAVDVVCSFEVIEHLFAPREFLLSCRRAMRENKLLVLSCPNGEGFDIATLGAKSLAVDAEHLNLFNPRSLTRLVESCGFMAREVTTPGRLDAEFVRDAILSGDFDADSAFLRQVLIDDWDRLGGPFQKFLADNGLSSHMWLVATAR